ncbi:MAG TPA: phosphopantothenoylcysteine decarboxylase [Opitutaceae bacterium]|nr:phosphopantothenoylcysteine decarboxylase [Opitutaceae bacterium]
MPLRFLITAGPTREHLDPIRYLSNGSSGRMGFALAAAALARGHHVDLVVGPVTIPAPDGAVLHRVVSGAEMLAACRPLFKDCDVFIAVAAVADYRPTQRASDKIKKTGGPLSLTLVPNVDVLKTLAGIKAHGQIVVGFAAETQEVERYARRKMAEKNCDWIVANDVSQPNIGIDSADNAVVVIGRNGTLVSFGPAPKAQVADFILHQILGDGGSNLEKSN